MPVHGRGPQVVLEGYARNVARGAAGRTMRENIAAMDALVIAGQVADGNAVDGSSRTGGQPYDVVVAQFPHETTTAYEIPAPLLQGLGGGSRGYGYYLPDYIRPGDPDATAGMNRAMAALVAGGGGMLRVPAGTYTLSAPILVQNVNISIVGDGKMTSRFVILHSGIGIDISQGTSGPSPYNYYVTIRDLGFGSTSSTGSLAALRISYPDGLITTPASIARSHVTLDNLEFVSDGGTTIANNFLKGIILFGAWAPRLTNCNFWGYALSAVTPYPEGMCLLDINVCVDTKLSFCEATHGDCLVYMSGYCEGCYIIFATVVGTNYAVNMNRTGSVQRGSRGIAWSLIGGEYSTNIGGLNLVQCNEAFTANCHFATYPSTTGWTAYLLDTCSQCKFNSDLVDASALSTATNIAHVTGVSQDNKWWGTTATNMDKGFFFDTGVIRNRGYLTFRNATLIPNTDNGTANYLEFNDENDGAIAVVGNTDIHGPDRQRIFGITNPPLLPPDFTSAGVTSHLRVAPGVGGNAAVLSTEGGDGTTRADMIVQMQGGGTVHMQPDGSPTLCGGSLRLSGNVGFYDTFPVTQPTVSGAKGSNAALGSLIAALVSLGLITDTTTA